MSVGFIPSEGNTFAQTLAQTSQGFATIAEILMSKKQADLRSQLVQAQIQATQTEAEIAKGTLALETAKFNEYNSPESKAARAKMEQQKLLKGEQDLMAGEQSLRSGEFELANAPVLFEEKLAESRMGRRAEEGKIKYYEGQESRAGAMFPAELNAANLKNSTAQVENTEVFEIQQRAKATRDAIDSIADEQLKDKDPAVAKRLKPVLANQIAMQLGKTVQDVQKEEAQTELMKGQHQALKVKTELELMKGISEMSKVQLGGLLKTDMYKDNPRIREFAENVYKKGPLGVEDIASQVRESLFYHAPEQFAQSTMPGLVNADELHAKKMEGLYPEDLEKMTPEEKMSPSQRAGAAIKAGQMKRNGTKKATTQAASAEPQPLKSAAAAAGEEMKITEAGEGAVNRIKDNLTSANLSAEEMITGKRREQDEYELGQQSGGAFDLPGPVVKKTGGKTPVYQGFYYVDKLPDANKNYLKQTYKPQEIKYALTDPDPQSKAKERDMYFALVTEMMASHKPREIKAAFVQKFGVNALTEAQKQQLNVLAQRFGW